MGKWMIIALCAVIVILIIIIFFLIRRVIYSESNSSDIDYECGDIYYDD